MELDPDGSIVDEALYLIDAACGHGSVIEQETGTVTPVVALAMEGRTSSNVDDRHRHEYAMNQNQAMSICGMLFVELDDHHRAMLVNAWRTEGLL